MSATPPQAPLVQRNRPLLVACIAINFMMLAGCAIFLWAADKGFDLTDEGLYLLVYQNPGEFRDSWTSYHRVGALVFPLLGHNIIALRITGFLSLSLATLLFSSSFISFLLNRGFAFLNNITARWCFHATLQTSVLAAYCWLPPTANYNTMAGIGMLCASGGILAILGRHRSALRLTILIPATISIGIGLMLTLLAKGSSAVAFVALTSALLLLGDLLPLKKRIILLAVSITALVGLGSLVFAFFPEWLVTVQFMLGSLIAILSGQGATGIVSRHFAESIEFAVRNWKSYHIPMLLTAGVGLSSRFSRSNPSVQRKILSWGVPFCLFVLFYYALDKNAFLAGISHRSGSMLGYTSCLIVLALLRITIPGATKAIPTPSLSILGVTALLLWLVLLPFATAAGTTHRIYVNSLLHTAPLLAAILFLAIWIDSSLHKKIVTPLTAVFLGALATSQFLSGFLFNPYRIAPKFEQTQPVEIGVPATTLKVDTSTALLIKQTRAALASGGFTPGEDILALYGLPGLVYAMGGVSPEKPWFFFDHGERGDRENMLALQSIPYERLKKAYLLHTNADSRASQQLKQLGIDFPEEYSQLGRVYWVYRNQEITIWRAR